MKQKTKATLKYHKQSEEVKTRTEKQDYPRDRERILFNRMCL